MEARGSWLTGAEQIGDALINNTRYRDAEVERVLANARRHDILPAKDYAEIDEQNREGQVAADNVADELKYSPVKTYIAAFIGRAVMDKVKRR